MTVDVAALTARLLPSPRPALTVYDGTGRVELSGRVIATWAYKTANLLAEEDAEGGTVLLDLPLTWRAVPATLGAWLAGASVAFQSATADIVFTDEPGRDYGAAEVFAVNTDPIALAWRGDLSGARDGIAEVTGQPDLLLAPPAPPAAIALAGPGVGFEDLVTVLGGGSEGRRAVRAASAWELTRLSLAQWAAGGSIVAFAPEVPDAERLAEQEGAALA